jgi:cation diffusion facilitator family transporter
MLDKSFVHHTMIGISDDQSGHLMDVTAKSEADRDTLRFAMNLSLAVGLLMFVMKTGAYLLTGSAAILSDAAESVTHVAAVFFAAYSLRLSYRPPDKDHLYGHAKISFFSAGFEGAMIILAALFIIYESIRKWMTGLQLENLGVGTALTAAAMIINGGLGGYLVWLGRHKHSLILEADGKHVLTDCVTSLAVLVGLVLVLLTKWAPFDPICGILTACNIFWSGTGLLKAAFVGLMDTADPTAHAKLTEVLDRETGVRGMSYHSLRHRNLGDAHWVEVHLLFPSDSSLAEAHRTATDIENVIEASLEPRAFVTTHLECALDHDALHPDEKTRQPR